jgi:hypothetical protein
MKRSLRSDSSRDRIPGSLEDDEEAIAGGVDLVAAVARECVAENAAMLASQVTEFRAQLAHEVGRALDVSEEERDGAVRKLGRTRLH